MQPVRRHHQPPKSCSYAPARLHACAECRSELGALGMLLDGSRAPFALPGALFGAPMNCVHGSLLGAPVARNGKPENKPQKGLEFRPNTSNPVLATDHREEPTMASLYKKPIVVSDPKTG